jgi:hypothetical protein
VTGRRRVGLALAALGAGLGVLAGAVQATVGSEIPAWTGDKADPTPLGLLTIGLSAAAGGGLLMARRPETAPGTRLAALAATVVVALVCFSTVGGLWLLPGPLLLVGALLAVGSWSDALRTARRHWPRVLIAALGGCQLLLAAGASPVLMVVGGASGVALVTAAVVSTRGPRVAAGLLVLGTVPFAVLAWTAFAPVLVLLLAGALARPALADAVGANPVPATEPNHH